jgi:hypothetical protein
MTVATMPRKRTRKDPVRTTVRTRRLIAANAKLQRNQGILDLYRESLKDGSIWDLPRICFTSGLSLAQVNRILKDAGLLPRAPADDPANSPDSDPLDAPLAYRPVHTIPLTPAELRECRRENATSPEALDWLENHRTDRRHNGRSMCRERLYDHPDFAEVDDADDQDTDTSDD